MIPPVDTIDVIMIPPIDTTDVISIYKTHNAIGNQIIQAIRFVIIYLNKCNGKEKQ